MFRTRPGEFVLAVHGTVAGLGVVFMLGLVVNRRLYVAPLGSPAFGEQMYVDERTGDVVSSWALIGCVDDLPDRHALGNIADAYRRHCAAHN